MSDTTDTTDYTKFPEVLAVLPLRNIVVFPGMIVPLFVGRDKSIRALEDVMADDKQIMLVAQRDGDLDDPSEEDVYDIGTVGTILQLLKLPDGTVKVLVEGLRRARLFDFVPNESFFQASVIGIEEEDLDSPDLSSLSKTVVGQFDNYVKMNRKIPQEVQNVIREIDDPQKLADTVAGHLNIQISEKQALLENVSVSERLENVLGHMENEVGLLQVEKKIRGRVKRQMEKTQREYYLNEQLKAIQKELGEGEDGMDDLAELEAQIEKTKFSKEAREKAQAEFKKLKNMSPMSAEATVVRNYLDWLLAVPWKKKSRVKRDLDNAEQVLEADHYGLEKVKERILEYLAVQNRTNKLKGPILCLVGPPGVGKTSLGKSLAKATGREFVRMSLGGVRDESEIRGHRRTYIGSMPGKIIQSMKKVKTSNPLILLDEIDKLGMDYRGDPASALLEVLDPEQNSTFNDHYLEVDYDLSKVMFVTTANTLNIPGPLLDRMEVIRIPGYTEDEKVEIAKRHLLPKSISNHGLKSGEFELSNEALRQIIRTYTREAGVRNLECDLANVCRKTVTKIVREKITDVSVIPDNLEDFLGVSRYRFGLAEKEDQVGVVTGLAWTQVGGELLTIEGVMLPGKGKMTTTGKLGDVMKESIGAASSYVRSKSVDLGIEPPLFDKKDIHVHVPEGATPKDGPSAGIAMATTIVSLMTGIEVCKEVAMTGEVTLRGQVLPIGGLKEKLLAARRGGVERVIIPHENAKDLSEVPDNIKDGLDIIPVQSMNEVLEIALTRMPEAIEWDQTAYEAKQQAAMTGPQDTQRTH